MELGQGLVIDAGGSVVAQIREYQIRRNAQAENVTVAGSGGKFLPTVVISSGTITAFRLRADAGQNALATGATVTIQLRPVGTGTGLAQTQITDAVIGDSDERVRADGYSEITFSWSGGAPDDTAQ